MVDVVVHACVHHSDGRGFPKKKWRTTKHGRRTHRNNDDIRGDKEFDKRFVSVSAVLWTNGRIMDLIGLPGSLATIYID